MTFHEHLARRRKALGLSQEELAAKIGAIVDNSVAHFLPETKI